MDRNHVLNLMSQLRLRGMRASYDEVLADGTRRKHPPQRIVAALLEVEVADKKARSIQYRMTTAKLPMAKDISDFDFSLGSVSESLIHQLADGGLLAAHRNMVLVGGTGTGKTHLAMAVARMCIRNGATGRFRRAPALQCGGSGQSAGGGDSRWTSRAIVGAVVAPQLRDLGRVGVFAICAKWRSVAVSPDLEALRAGVHCDYYESVLWGMADGVW